MGAACGAAFGCERSALITRGAGGGGSGGAGGGASAGTGSGFVAALGRHGGRLEARLFTASEIADCAKRADRVQALAARFADVGQWQW